MAPPPQWVRDLKPSAPQGVDLLKAERDKSNISVEKLSEFLFTKEILERQQRILNILTAEKVFDKSQNYFDGRVEKFKTALARAKRMRQLQVKHNWSRDEFQMADSLVSEPGPYGLHASMFLTTLRDQGTPEQHKLFLEPAENYKYIGCYAQTELGHGSNVRGLETTATWNPEDKTFILHSPHLTASKWWIGSLGRTANHAVVMAQLIIGGRPYGPHPFVCQIRDLKTHEPLEGIHVGDIGPKFGYNTMDNGFLLLNHVKIPHVNMLARYSSVDPETNKYLKPSSPSLIYGTLTWVRSTIVLQSGGVLARGVTIATRYAAVRRQFQDRDSTDNSGGENQVLNYTMVQFRLLPLLASSFALHFTGKAMMGLYQENQKNMQRVAAGKADANRGAGPEETHSGSDLLADLHATSCGLKALGSTTAAEGLEVCRRACGGHGYSSFGGIGAWYADYLPTTTWEGDNYMLTQQVARYLLKSARSVLKGEAPNNDTTKIFSTFLEKQDMGAAFDVLGSDSDLVAAFAWRTSFLTFEALKHRDAEKNSWNSLLVDFWRLSTAHSQYLVVKNFYDALQDESLHRSLDSGTVSVLHKLFRLYALNTLEKEASEFYSSAAVTVRQIQLARTKSVMKLLEEIRPHALRLVDAWNFPDWQLDSSLGREDGKVYEDMFYRASELNPLNGLTIDPYPDSDVLVKKDETARYKICSTSYEATTDSYQQLTLSYPTTSIVNIITSFKSLTWSGLSNEEVILIGPNNNPRTTRINSFPNITNLPSITRTHLIYSNPPSGIYNETYNLQHIVIATAGNFAGVDYGGMMVPSISDGRVGMVNFINVVACATSVAAVRATVLTGGVHETDAAIVQGGLVGESFAGDVEIVGNGSSNGVSNGDSNVNYNGNDTMDDMTEIGNMTATRPTSPIKRIRSSQRVGESALAGLGAFTFAAMVL